MAKKNGRTWIDIVADAAGAIGFNRVKVYWKLTRWQESQSRASQGRADTIKHVGYKHRVCTNCGRLQDRSRKTCENCGVRLLPQFLEVFRRIGLVSPHLASISSLLIIALVVCFIRTVMASPETRIMNIDAQTLVAFGGNVPYLTMSGQWWRLATSVFLHGGLLHIIFNVVALKQIGPEVESIFGRGRFIFYFMITGILASAGSLVWHQYSTHGNVVSIGASGAIMGLVGIVAGWGHKDGTTIGRSMRDMMLKWGLYTIMFGFFIGADNAAHIAGLAAGAMIGLFAKPRMRRQPSALVDWGMMFAGTSLAVGTLILIMMPSF